MNELELLQNQIDEVPEPSPEFVWRVRGRLTEAMAEEGSGKEQTDSRRHVTRRPSSRVVLVAATVILVFVAAVATYSALGNKSVPGTRVASGTWHLAGYLVAQSGTENEYGPTSGYLTCPTSTVCYDASAQISQVGSSYIAGKSVLFVTMDKGASWEARDLPTGVTLTTRLECVTIEACALGATGPGPSGSDTTQILMTSDGGNSWVSHDLPAGIGSLYALSCPSTGTCSGLASLAPSHLGDTLVETHDGGTTWSQYAFPGDQVETAISCSSGRCLVIGDQTSTTPGIAGYGVSWTDGGGSWHSELIKGASLGVSFGQGNLTCPSATFCMAIAAVPHESTHCSAQAEAASEAAGNNCQCPPETSTSSSSSTGCVTGQNVITEPAVTTDGGVSWTLESFPASVPSVGLFDVDCPTTDLCWSAGLEDVPNQSVVGGIRYGSGSSPIVLMSQDGGVTWVAHTFATPSTAPAGETLSGIDQVQCQPTNSCVALGLDMGGAAHTIVYTFDG
jgi:hypothetical protein